MTDDFDLDAILAAVDDEGNSLKEKTDDVEQVDLDAILADASLDMETSASSRIVQRGSRETLEVDALLEEMDVSSLKSSSRDQQKLKHSTFLQHQPKMPSTSLGLLPEPRNTENDVIVDEGTAILKSDFEIAEARVMIGALKPHRIVSSLSDEKDTQHVVEQILVLESFDQLAQFIRLAKHHNKAGNVSCSMFHQRYIVIGMTSGIIFLFDHYQNHLGTIRSQFQSSPCAISAIDVSVDGMVLYTGDITGNVLIWDLGANILIKSLPECMPCRVDRILSCNNSRENPSFLCMDSRGAICKLTLSKFLFTLREEKEVICPSLGSENRLLERFIPNPKIPHPLDSVLLFSHANDDLVSINVLAQNTKREIDQIRRPLSALKSSRPCIAWKLLRTSDISSAPVAQTAQGKEDFAHHPVFAVGWGKSVVCKSVLPYGFYGERKMTSLRTLNPRPSHLTLIELDENVIALQWFGGKILLVITDSDKIHAVDTMSGTVLETLQFPCHSIGNQHVTSTTSSLMSSCVSGSDKKLFMFTFDETEETVFHVLHLCSWMDRLENLIRSQDWIFALRLALRLYDGSERMVIELPRPPMLKDRILILLLRYVDTVLLTACDSALSKEVLKEIAFISIDFCSRIDDSHFFLEEVFKRFQSLGHQDLFLSCVEPFILSKSLGGLGVTMLTAFVENYCINQKKSEVELCLYHLDFSKTDLGHVIGLCIKFGLVSSILYIYTEGLNDVITPLMKIVRMAGEGKIPDSDIQDSVWKVLIFLKCCFGGTLYPFGTKRSDSETRHLQAMLIKFCFDPDSIDRTTSNESLLVFLLKHNTSGLLKLVQFAFDNAEILDCSNQAEAKPPEDSFSWCRIEDILKRSSQSAGLPQIALPTPRNPEVGTLVPPGTQEIANILLIAVLRHPLCSSDLIEFMFFYCNLICERSIKTPTSFVSRLRIFLLEGRIQLPSDDFQIPKHIEKQTKEKREQFFLKLLQHYPLESSVDVSDAIQRALEFGLFGVCSHLYILSGDQIRAFEILLKNDAQSIYQFLFESFESDDCSNSDRKLLCGHILQNVSSLMQNDPIPFFQFIVIHVPHLLNQISSALEEYPEHQFRFLDYISKSITPGREYSVLIKRSKNAFDTSRPLIESFINFPSVQQLYISLMCRFEPFYVYGYLVSHHNYNIEEAMELCRSYKINDAAAYLLERTGDSKGALSLMLRAVNNAIKLMVSFLEANPLDLEDEKKENVTFSEIVDVKEYTELQKKLELASQLCERSSLRKDLHCRELWFRVLDFLIATQQQFDYARDDYEIATGVDLGIKEKRVFYSVLIECIRNLLKKMKEHVPVRDILVRIADETSNLRFSEFRDTLSEMLHLYNSEIKILDSALNVFQRDIYCSSVVLHDGHSRSFLPNSLTCSLCSGNLRSRQVEMEEVCVFTCNHAYHYACIKDEPKCILCSSKHHPISGIGKSHDVKRLTQRISKAASFSSDATTMDKDYAKETKSFSPYQLFEKLYIGGSSWGVFKEKQTPEKEILFRSVGSKTKEGKRHPRFAPRDLILDLER